MRFIVTGATSMIGSAFLKVAIAEGHEIVALVRKNSNNKSRLPDSRLVTVVACDLNDIESVQIAENEYDAFYHFAWDYTSREGRNNIEGQEYNIRLCLNAVRLADKYKCKRFIGAGSQSEYGIVDGIIDENTPLNPLMPYAMAKVAAYWLSKNMCEQLGILHIWGRIFSVYGNHDHEGTLLLYAIDCFIKGEKAFFSSGNQMWNYLHESDAGEMFLRLCTCKVGAGTFFIANNESKPLKDYLEILISIFGEKVEYSFASSDEKRGYGINPDMNQTMKALNYEPKTSFEVGINQMVENRIMNKCT